MLMYPGVPTPRNRESLEIAIILIPQVGQYVYEKRGDELPKTYCYN